jgi:hypothetical protein
MEQQRLVRPIGKRMDLMPHNARRIEDINQIGNQTQQGKIRSVFGKAGNMIA